MAPCGRSETPGGWPCVRRDGRCWAARSWCRCFCRRCRRTSSRESFALLLLAVPLYLMYQTYQVYIGRIGDEQQQVKQTAELHLATIEALARAIDAKEQLSHNHVWRVQLYAARLAQALGLSDEEIQGIKTAALLHDIGKLAVPEHILSKPGPLTQEEFEKVRIHSVVGAEIISGVPFPYPVAAAILSHHERWDGGGYPHQLRGEAIPLGARILSIVDYFDSATSERPYHKALSHDEAAELIARESGAALDPRLVDTFIALLPSLLAESAAEEQKTSRAGELAATSAAAGSASADSVSDWPESVFENIALAHREVYALYEIAQSMSTSLGVTDTMALISSKLTKIVPWSGCSLFLYDGAARFADVRLRRRAGRAAAAQSHDLERRSPGRLGQRPPPDARERRSAAAPSRRPDPDRRTELRSAHGVSAVLRRHVHRRVFRLPRRRGTLYRRSPPTVRARRRADRDRAAQFPRIRANAKRTRSPIS